ncbi:MAG: tetratricopeptide repeat protein, partial [Phycisphaerales bacterium]|nr:tetratricopeptide repeat protein [Phycisphaerales bacterium]
MMMRSVAVQSRSWPKFIAMMTVVLCTFAATSFADVIWFRNSSIPLRDVRIENVEGAQVSYVDSNARRQSRAVHEIDALEFDVLPTLTTAEQYVRDNHVDAAIAMLLQTLVRTTERDQHRLWLHIRLAQLHARRGEYVESASHVASVYILNDHPGWSELEPTGAFDQPNPVAVTEALDRLRTAERTVRSASLRLSIRRMREHIEPSATGTPAAQRGQTFSGLTTGEIAHLDPRAMARPGMPEAPTRGPDVAPEDTRPDTIAALLRAERFDEALSICERIAAAPDQRGVGTFLLQFGEALEGVGRHDDAAMRYSQAAIHESATEPG